jgi:pyruvate dehydrogenase E1 component
MVARWLPEPYLALGTDGYGRSDTREALRDYFEIDPPHIAAAALTGLARGGNLAPATAAAMIAELGVDPEAADPLSR